jgi:CRISPR/Cas system-associated protein Cas10 (large subunit of type III CRISPR-Cas system)
MAIQNQQSSKQSLLATKNKLTALRLIQLEGLLRLEGTIKFLQLLQKHFWSVVCAWLNVDTDLDVGNNKIELTIMCVPW